MIEGIILRLQGKAAGCRESQKQERERSRETVFYGLFHITILDSWRPGVNLSFLLTNKFLDIR